MKVLIATAVWGKTYCSVFTRFSLASLLASGNIPELAKHAGITFHIVTTKRDRRWLVNDPAMVELLQYCQVEWEMIEDFGVFQPPEGPGGEKYPFLSALQNIAIQRSLDHDAIVFNYADFIWSNGSLTAAIELLNAAGKPADAVLAFSVPVDRDAALPALQRYRLPADSNVIELSPREGAVIAVEHMHREARNRLWNSPGFTVTPSYLFWEVDGQGLVARAYHQTVLAMRVRADDPTYRQGIVRGSLDACLTAQLAKSGAVAVATDTGKILVFSLYHTPVDSRMPAGMTREMSLQTLLRGDVIPEQRSFAEHAFYFKLHDGDEAQWTKVTADSARLLREAESAVAFDRALYDRNLETHGVIPRMVRLNSLQRHIQQPFMVAVRWTGVYAAAIHMAAVASRYGSRGARIFYVLWHPFLLKAAIDRRRERYTARGLRLQRIGRVLVTPPLLGDALKRQLRFLVVWRRGFYFAPNVWIPRRAHILFADALAIEDSISRIPDNAQLIVALQRAEGWLRRAIDIAPLWIHAVRALGRNLWFQGRFDDAKRVWMEAEGLRDDVARTADWPVASCIFLPRNCAQSIGLMGHLDAFTKHRTLTGDKRPYYLLAPRQDIVNTAFLDYWRDHLTIVSDPDEIKKMAPLENVYGVNWNWMMPADVKLDYAGGKPDFIHAGIAAVERAWQREKRPPLLQLRSTHAETLAELRGKWGMRQDERFVCLHVRSEGFYGNANEKLQQFRNTAIESYYPLMRALADMGLWVIRMGDAGMPPLDPAQCGNTGRIIDYATSADRSAERDVALCAQCELFVSAPSGLLTVAHAFGRRICNVNYPIYNGFPWHPDHIFIPQLYFSHAKGRMLTLAEIMGTDMVHHDHQFLLDRAGVSLIPNQPDDLVEAVREALAPSAYKVPDEALANRVCAVFDDLNRKHNVGISGRLGRHFAQKYASQLVHDGSHPQDLMRAKPAPRNRKLDFLIPCFNRVNPVYHILKTGLALNIPGAYFVVIDDGSYAFEDVPGLGRVNTEMACRSFNDERVIYSRNPVNMGVARSLERYYREICDAEYASLLNPKDEFLSGEPVTNALVKLDADPAISFVVFPLRQIDQIETDKALLFDYIRMSGPDFIARHVRDSMLQHCSGYAIIRVSAMRKAGIPRSLDLRALGLEDGSGIDHEMIYNAATTGDVDFVSEAPIRRKIVGGYTEYYPLTFAYTQYQYAKRLMNELEPRGIVSAATRRRYLGFWHLIIARGLVVAYRHVHGSELEEGVKRIRPHLPMPILLYLPYETVRSGVVPRLETVVTYLVGARLVLTDWLRKILGRPHIA